jgi:hypothetical protein
MIIVLIDKAKTGILHISYNSLELFKDKRVLYGESSVGGN